MIAIMILIVLLSINIYLSSTLNELKITEGELNLKNNLLKFNISKGDNSVNNINYQHYDEIYHSKRDNLYHLQLQLMITLKDNEKKEDELNELKKRNSFLIKEIEGVKKLILKYERKALIKINNCALKNNREDEVNQIEK